MDLTNEKAWLRWWKLHRRGIDWSNGSGGAEGGVAVLPKATTVNNNGEKLLHGIPGLQRHGANVGGDVFVHFVGGGLDGATAASVTDPLDLARTRLAAQTNVIYYRGIGHTLRTICRDEGVMGLYKGLGATLLGVGPNIAISFTAYETLRSSWVSHRPDDPTVAVSLACSSLSGIASSTGDVEVTAVVRTESYQLN